MSVSNTMNPGEARALVESSTRISFHTFETVLGVLTGMALCCYIARIAIRLVYQKTLRLDDAFLIFAVASLCAATGILYSICYFSYLHAATLFVPKLVPYLLGEYTNLLHLQESQERVYPYLALIWTTTFGVKGCFLAFMRPLVWHVSRAMNWYFWFIVVFTAITWAFVVADPFIICPYFKLEAVKCFSSTVASRKTLGLTALVTVLDILSDIMIVSLPVLILKDSRLSNSTKFGLGVFLCLSVVMAVFAVIKMAGFHYRGLEDDTWQFFWQQAEGAVAVMMASITAFRTLFVKPDHDPNISTQRSPVENFFHRIYNRFRTLAQADPGEKPISATPSKPLLRLSKIPTPTFTGIRTFIHKNNRSNMESAQFDSLHSNHDSVEVDYHDTIRHN